MHHFPTKCRWQFICVGRKLGGFCEVFSPKKIFLCFLKGIKKWGWGIILEKNRFIQEGNSFNRRIEQGSQVLGSIGSQFTSQTPDDLVRGGNSIDNNEELDTKTALTAVLPIRLRGRIKYDTLKKVCQCLCLRNYSFMIFYIC